MDTYRWGQEVSETRLPSQNRRRRFLLSCGLEEKEPYPRQEHLHIYCLHWIMGLANSTTPPQRARTHTRCCYHHGPHGVDQRLQHSRAEGKSPLSLAATCGELGSIDQTRWLCVLPPGAGCRPTHTQTHAHTRTETWRCTQLTGCFDT